MVANSFSLDGMKLISRVFSSMEELHALLAEEELKAAVRAAQSVLAEVYNKDDDRLWLGQVVDAVGLLREDIVIAGATTFGHISAGKVADAKTIISFSCFHTAELVLIEEECEPGDEEEAARHIIDTLGNRTSAVKGLLMLATPLSINCNLLLSSIHALSPGLPVFGGGSSDISLQKMLVFSRRRMFRSGLVAVALCGGSLEVMRSVHLGWLPVGRRMVITKAQGPVVETIDHKPAIDVFKRYLGITSDERFFLNVMEFPLLVDRCGELHARVPYEAGEDGSIRFTAELREGEEVHFGYARVEAMQHSVQSLEAAVREFGPEAIHIYSCIIRHFVLQRDIDLELSPFERLAPSAGFFTAGEFCSQADASLLRNAVMVVVAMRESPQPSRPKRHDANATKQDPGNLYEDNHTRILQRYQHFVQAITEDLERANEELARLAERDVLTGLYNRRRLDSVLQTEIGRSRRYGKSFSVIVSDVDHFKRFNDVYGHQAGDAVLRELARVIQAEVRTADVVCRFGGEEFVIVMPETGPDEAVVFADRLRGLLEGLSIRHQDLVLPATTMSFGVAGFPCNGRTPDELISAADAALYDAKRQGRNRVCLSMREADNGKR